MRAIFLRELKAYFTSPIGYVFMGFFILLSGIFFAYGNLLPASSSYTGLLSSVTFIFLIVVPILTMRLIAEDKKQKTDQLLITSPISITGIVLGKYLAAVAVFFLTLVVTLAYPVMMSFFSFGPLAWPEILGGYLGFLLLGSAFIAVGLFFSSVTDNQIIAAVVTFGALLVIWILDYIAQYLPSDAVSGLVFLSAAAIGVAALVFFSTRNIYITAASTAVMAGGIVTGYLLKRAFFEGLITKVLDWFSLLKRYNDFSLGILGLSPIVYYLSFSAAFIFLTVRMIDKRRWA
jgi:ABC-2 type transport system permease protein